MLRCVAKGVLKKALGELQSGQGFRQRLLDIANQTYGDFQKETRTVRYLEVLAAVALASPEESKHISAQVVEELRSDGTFKDLLEKPETVERLLGYLEQVPVSVRNRFRRPMDPTGRSLPQDFRLARPEDLMVLLPPKAPQFRVGDQPVGNWRLVQLLGIGAFGEVWKAEDAMDGDSPDVPPVALKFCLSPESIRNLRHETGLLQRIEKHLGEMKGIVRLRKAWLEAEPPCLEYEYVNGGDLCGLMGEWLVQTPEKRATLALQMLHRLAKVIAPLHEMDPPIVHRDLKPANVLVSKGPNNKFDMKISDFGISGVAAGMALEGYAQSLSQSEILTSTLRGTHTPLYASPEQRAGSAPHPTDDVHALGVIGFQLLVCDLKRSPTSDWDEELRERSIGDEPIQILRKCLARKNNRHQSAGELRDVLFQCLEGSKPQIAVFGDSHLQPLPRRFEKIKSGSDPVMDILLSKNQEFTNSLKIDTSSQNINKSNELTTTEEALVTKNPQTEKSSNFKSKNEKDSGRFLRICLLTVSLLILSGIPIFFAGLLVGKGSMLSDQQLLQTVIENLDKEKTQFESRVFLLAKELDNKNQLIESLKNLTDKMQSQSIISEKKFQEEQDKYKKLESYKTFVEKLNLDLYKQIQNKLINEKIKIDEANKLDLKKESKLSAIKKPTDFLVLPLIKKIDTEQIVTCFSLSPDGKQVACGLNDGRTVLINLGSNKNILTLQGEKITEEEKKSENDASFGSVYSVSFSPVGSRIASAQRIGSEQKPSTIKVWDTKTGVKITSFIGSRNHMGFFLNYSPDARIIGKMGGDKVSLCNASTGRLVSQITATGTDFCFSFDSKLIAAGNGNSIQLSDTLTGRIIKNFSIDSDYIRSMAFYPDGKKIIVSTDSSESDIKILDLETSQVVKNVKDTNMLTVTQVCVNPSGNLIAGRGIDNLVRIWNYASGKLVAKFNGHENENGNFLHVSGINFSSDGKTLITSGFDGFIKIWNIEGLLK
jgi:WD40 repeat protein